MPFFSPKKVIIQPGCDNISQVNAQCRFCGSYPYDDCPPQPRSTTTDSSATTTVWTSTATSTAVLTSSDTSSAPEEELQPWAFNWQPLFAMSEFQQILKAWYSWKHTICIPVLSCSTWWQEVGHFGVVCSVLRPVNKRLKRKLVIYIAWSKSGFVFLSHLHTLAFGSWLCLFLARSNP